MRLIFAGTPEFAAEALSALLEAGHEIAMVLTQPDRPAGRGMQLQASPVKRLAEQHGIRVFQPLSLKLAEVQAEIAQVHASLMVVVAYGLILPQAVLDLPTFGCINIHASLLPRWRGAAPIHRAIQAGDSETGVCIMQMEAGLDTGPVLLEGRIPIEPEDTTGSLHDKLAFLGGQLVVEALAHWPLPAVVQASEGVCYAHKIEKHEAVLNWRLSAAVLARQIRAFNPFPGAQAMLEGQTLKIWRASAESGAEVGEIGQILSVDRDKVRIACGDGVLQVTELQKAGGKRLPVAQFLAGTPLSAGMRMTLPASD